MTNNFHVPYVLRIPRKMTRRGGGHLVCSPSPPPSSPHHPFFFLLPPIRYRHYMKRPSGGMFSPAPPAPPPPPPPPTHPSFLLPRLIRYETLHRGNTLFHRVNAQNELSKLVFTLVRRQYLAKKLNTWPRYLPRCKTHRKLHPGFEWHIFHILTSEDIDDIISLFYTVENGKRVLPI